MEGLEKLKNIKEVQDGRRKRNRTEEKSKISGTAHRQETYIKEESYKKKQKTPKDQEDDIRSSSETDNIRWSKNVGLSSKNKHNQIREDAA